MSQAERIGLYKRESLLQMWAGSECEVLTHFVKPFAYGNRYDSRPSRLRAKGMASIEIPRMSGLGYQAVPKCKYGEHPIPVQHKT
jgi:hypothetical protein